MMMMMMIIPMEKPYCLMQTSWYLWYFWMLVCLQPDLFHFISRTVRIWWAPNSMTNPSHFHQHALALGLFIFPETDYGDTESSTCEDRVWTCDFLHLPIRFLNLTSGAKALIASMKFERYSFLVVLLQGLHEHHMACSGEWHLHQLNYKLDQTCLGLSLLEGLSLRVVAHGRTWFQSCAVWRQSAPLSDWKSSG